MLSGSDWWGYFVQFLVLSLMSVGGAIATIPEMHRYLVLQKGWLTDPVFASSVALAQAAPGPNVLIVPATMGLAWVYVPFVTFVMTGTSNAVNLTDGLDGLATGVSLIVFGAYVVVAIWQNNQSCRIVESLRCYETRDPLDLDGGAAGRGPVSG